MQEGSQDVREPTNESHSPQKKKRHLRVARSYFYTNMTRHAYLAISGIVHISMETIICYAAGESKGNPGPSAFAVYIESIIGEVIEQRTQTIGNATSDFAAYNAVMVCLQTLQSVYGETTTQMQFEVRLDCKLVANHLTARVPINDPGLVPMFIEIHNMRVASFPNIKFTIVSPEENQKAITLLKPALDGK